MINKYIYIYIFVKRPFKDPVAPRPKTLDPVQVIDFIDPVSHFFVNKSYRPGLINAGVGVKEQTFSLQETKYANQKSKSFLEYNLMKNRQKDDLPYKKQYLPLIKHTSVL